VHYATNPLRCFTAESRFSAACTDVGRDTFNQHVFAIDHEYFIDGCLAGFRRTAYMAAKHISFPSVSLHFLSSSKYTALGNSNSQQVYLQSAPSEFFGKSAKRGTFL
jgi:hypothetical protein